MKHRRGAKAVTHMSIKCTRDLGQEEKVCEGEMGSDDDENVRGQRE